MGQSPIEIAVNAIQMLRQCMCYLSGPQTVPVRDCFCMMTPFKNGDHAPDGSRPPRVKKTSYPVTYNLHAALRRSQGLRSQSSQRTPRPNSKTLCRGTYGREELDHQKTHGLTLFGGLEYFHMQPLVTTLLHCVGEVGMFGPDACRLFAENVFTNLPSKTSNRLCSAFSPLPWLLSRAQTIPFWTLALIQISEKNGEQHPYMIGVGPTGLMSGCQSPNAAIYRGEVGFVLIEHLPHLGLPVWIGCQALWSVLGDLFVDS